jgi:uncharacterized membrane protein
MQEYFVFFFGFGILLIIHSIPLYLKLIKPNKFYGFRLPAAFESDEKWFKINYYGAKKSIQVAVLNFGLGGLCILIKTELISEDYWMWIGVAPIILSLILLTALTYNYSKKL